MMLLPWLVFMCGKSVFYGIIFYLFFWILFFCTGGNSDKYYWSSWIHFSYRHQHQYELFDSFGRFEIGEFIGISPLFKYFVICFLITVSMMIGYHLFQFLGSKLVCSIGVWGRCLGECFSWEERRRRGQACRLYSNSIEDSRDRIVFGRSHHRHPETRHEWPRASLCCYTCHWRTQCQCLYQQHGCIDIVLISLNKGSF